MNVICEMFDGAAQWVGLRALPNSVQFKLGSRETWCAFPAATQEVLPGAPEKAPGRFLNVSLMFWRRLARGSVYRLCEVSHSNPLSTVPVRSASRRIRRGRPVAGALGRVGTTAFTRVLGARTRLPSRGRVAGLEVRRRSPASKKMGNSTRERAGRGPPRTANPGLFRAFR